MSEIFKNLTRIFINSFYASRHIENQGFSGFLHHISGEIHIRHQRHHAAEVAFKGKPGFDGAYRRAHRPWILRGFHKTRRAFPPYGR